MVQQLLDIKKRKSGFVTIVSVLALSSLGVLVITTRLLINTDTTISIGTIQDGKNAKYIAESCAEITLNNLRADINYSGGEILEIFSGLCEVSSIIGNGNTDRSFTVTAKFEDYTQIIEINIASINPELQLTSWSVIQ